MNMNDSERFQWKLMVARHLANNYGWYIELAKPRNIPGNLDFDAWVNGSQKWAFEIIESENLEDLQEEIDQVSWRAYNVYLEIPKSIAPDILASAIHRAYHNNPDIRAFIHYRSKDILLNHQSMKDESTVLSSILTVLTS